MPELIAALDAFLQEHRLCGEIDGGVDDAVAWMACDCGGEHRAPGPACAPFVLWLAT